MSSVIESLGSIQDNVLGFAVDRFNAARVSYYHPGKKELRYAIRLRGETLGLTNRWRIEVPRVGFNDIGKYSSLALDRFGRAHIAFYSQAQKTIEYYVEPHFLDYKKPIPLSKTSTKDLVSNPLPINTSPTVAGISPNKNVKPPWSWTPLVTNGSGLYRYKLDHSNLNEDATETSETFFTPATNLTEGTHTLYVEENIEGFWSKTGSKAITIDTTAPTAKITYSINQTLTGGETLTITATFNENISDSPVPTLRVQESSQTISKPMTKVSATVYQYVHTVGTVNGTAAVTLQDAKDLAGNVVQSTPVSGGSFTINTDPSSPSAATISINHGQTTTFDDSVTLTLAAQDNIGVTGYYLSENSQTPAFNASGWISVTSTKAFSQNAAYTFPYSNGTKTLYAWFKDAVGNVAGPVNDSITAILRRPQTITMTDSDPQVGEIGGTLTISKVPDESELIAYNLYWGTDANTKTTLI
ncbi:hypothetical protein WDW89_03935, partial [Deltaproteobacteria bacterium TL4]